MYYNVSLQNIFHRTSEIFTNGGVDAILRGMLAQRAGAGDSHINGVLNDRLFQDDSKKAQTHLFSLTALNINRGRDHGLLSYVNYRSLVNLSIPKNFSELDNIPEDVRLRLSQTYKYVEDIDLYTGGLAETPIVGGVVGPTFARMHHTILNNVFYFY